ncbi:hypothetical protein KQI84_10625 [bacterium]|nr:hypothetical protein [bacterium]
MDRTFWKACAVALFAMVLAVPAGAQRGDGDWQGGRRWQGPDRREQPAAEAPRAEQKPPGPPRAARGRIDELAPLFEAGREMRRNFHDLERLANEHQDLVQRLNEAKEAEESDPHRLARMERIAELQAELLELQREEFVDRLRDRAPDAARRLGELSDRLAELDKHAAPDERLAPAREGVERMRELMVRLSGDEPVPFEDVAEVLSEVGPPRWEKDTNRERTDRQIERIQREMFALRGRLEDLQRELSRLQGDYFGFNQEADPQWPTDWPDDRRWQNRFSQPDPPSGPEAPQAEPQGEE